MSSSISVVTFVAALIAICHASIPSPAFPEYSYRDHPLFTYSFFESSSPTPIIMDRYYLGPNRREVRGARFTPSIATYTLIADTAQRFCNELDTLILPESNEAVGETFVEFKLTGDARVVIVLSDGDLSEESLQARPPMSVTGLTGWSDPVAIYGAAHGRPIEGLDRPNRLPSYGVAIVASMEADTWIKLPNAQSISVDGYRESP